MIGMSLLFSSATTNFFKGDMKDDFKKTNFNNNIFFKTKKLIIALGSGLLPPPRPPQKFWVRLWLS